MPAINAPSTIDMPASCISNAAPITTSSEVAVRISGIPEPAATCKTGLSKNRPPIISPASMAILVSTSTRLKSLAAAELPSKGMITINGITARSWNNNIEKAARPCVVVSCFFSASICNTKAVDDRARVNPTTVAAVGSMPAINASPPMTRALTNTCAAPSPNTILRKTHRRDGCNSSPIMNNSSTTPSSAKCSMCSGSEISLRLNGPMIIPAAR